MSDKMKLIMENWKFKNKAGEELGSEESAALEVALLVHGKGGGLEMQKDADGNPALDNKAQSLIPAVIANQQLDPAPSTEAIIKQLYFAHKQLGPDVEYSVPQWDEEKGMMRTSPKYTNEALDKIIDEEIGAYLEENSVGGGAVAGYAVKEEEVDEGRRGRGIDPKAHKFNRKKPDPYFFTNPRDRSNPIPKQLHKVSPEAEWEAFTGQTGGEVCSLKFSDVPGTFPQGHPEYDKTPIDPETGMPVEAKTVYGMANRHNLHKWMCSNPKSKPIPITAKKPAKGRYDAAGTPVQRPLRNDDDFDRYIDEGVERPKGISLRVTTPDTLDEI